MNLLELAERIGIQAKRVASTNGGEWKSACPVCSGRDRFFMQPYKQMGKCFGYFKCRHCEVKGDSIEFARKFLNCSFQDAAELVNAIMPEKIISLPFKKQQIVRPMILQAPSKEWIVKATEFVYQAHDQILHNHKILLYLARRGLSLEAVVRYKLGWTSQEHYLLRTDWDLPEQEDGLNKNRLYIPKGLIIPIFQGDKVLRFKVRRSNWSPADTYPKYIAVSGSMNGLSVIGSRKLAVIMVVESELDAFAIDHAVGDIVCAIAVGSNIKNPDNVTDQLAQKAKLLLICHDNDSAGNKMLLKWQKLYPHAIGFPTPIGKDIGQAIEESLNIREWILQKIQTN